MQQDRALGFKKGFVLLLSIVLFIIGIWFSLNCFDEQGKVKELYILLASCSIGFSLKNLYPIYKGYYKK